jgi:mxaK protein
MESVVSLPRKRWWRFVALFAGIAALAAGDMYRLYGIERWNERIAAIEVGDRAQSPVALGPRAPVEARFAVASAAARQGEVTRAVALYQEIAHARPQLAGAALFDAGNALLREGTRIAARGDWVQARPLFELAKETYREALRFDPGRWDARYNLERALRAAPEDESAQAENEPMGGESERSVTTMRAFTLGLP